MSWALGLGVAILFAWNVILTGLVLRLRKWTRVERVESRSDPDSADQSVIFEPGSAPDPKAKSSSQGAASPTPGPPPGQWSERVELGPQVPPEFPAVASVAAQHTSLFEGGVANDPGVPPWPMFEVKSQPPRPSPPAPPSQVESAPAFLAEFNVLANNFELGAVDAFRARWKPRGFKCGDHDPPSWDEAGPLWLIEIDPGHGAVLPSTEVARNWSKFYRSLDGAQAKRDLGVAFDFETGSILSITAAAEAKVEADHVIIVRKGKLSGI